MNIKQAMALSLAAMMTIIPIAAKSEDVGINPISAPIEVNENERVMYPEFIEFRGKID